MSTKKAWRNRVPYVNRPSARRPSKYVEHGKKKAYTSPQNAPVYLQVNEGRVSRNIMWVRSGKMLASNVILLLNSFFKHESRA